MIFLMTSQVITYVLIYNDHYSRKCKLLMNHTIWGQRARELLCRKGHWGLADNKLSTILQCPGIKQAALTGTKPVHQRMVLSSSTQTLSDHQTTARALCAVFDLPV